MMDTNIKGDWTWMQHTAIAVAVNLLVGLLTGAWFAGALLGVGVFLGREHAQAEYRWIANYGNGTRDNLPWWGAFDPRVWQKLGDWLDWCAPAVAVFIVTVLHWSLS